ncbi:MAG: fumarylacetoacetate hydrolase family protein [Proteobacteria bacterium]|nr:fumarylacetoacetate hydrolase family protein [Pseudomonadota bacterium]
MKLATQNNGTRDGQLIVVNRQLTRYLPAPYPTLQSALDDWQQATGPLQACYAQLSDDSAGQVLDLKQLLAPLPRAYQWLDGSAYLNHVELVRKARGAEMPLEFLNDPLMYQGGSDTMLAWHDDIAFATEEIGIDCEAEVVVVTDDVAKSCDSTHAGKHIQLIGIVNDISLRNLIPAELAKGFGFLQSKPPTAFAPVLVTPDELTEYWHDDKLHLAMNTSINGKWFGSPNCGSDMQFNFATLIAHAATTRPLAAGTIIGSGTISNKDRTKGFSCIAELRMIETIEQGKPTSNFLRFGDTVKIEIVDKQNQSIFGAIEQQVIKA